MKRYQSQADGGGIIEASWRCSLKIKKWKIKMKNGKLGTKNVTIEMKREKSEMKDKT